MVVVSILVWLFRDSDLPHVISAVIYKGNDAVSVSEVNVIISYRKLVIPQVAKGWGVGKR